MIPSRSGHGGARPGSGGPRGPRPLTLARERLVQAFALATAGPAAAGLNRRELLGAAATGLLAARELELAAWCLRQSDRLATNRSRHSLPDPPLLHRHPQRRPARQRA